VGKGEWRIDYTGAVRTRLSMEKVTIRPASGDDIDAICALLERCAEEGVAWGFVAATPQRVTEQLGPLCLIGEADGGVIGFAAGSLHTNDGAYGAVTRARETYLEVDDLYVAPELRSRGIGGRLLEALIEAARWEGVTRVHLFSTTKDHDAVLKFYRRHGFRPWGTQFYR